MTLFRTAWLLLGLAVACSGVRADNFDRWVSMTSFNDARQMLRLDDTIHIVTSGGLLAIGELDEAGRTFVNTDGLGTNDLSDVVRDDDGNYWLTGDGRLIKQTGEQFQPYLFLNDDNELIPLYCAVDDGDRLWVGTDIGLVLFSKVNDGGQIQDSYTLFGNFNPEPAVLDLMLQGDSIWIATSSGLAVADRSVPNQLKSPANWTVFGLADFPELGSDTTRRVVPFEGSIFTATPSGFFRLDRSPSDTSFTRLDVGTNEHVWDLRVDFDTLFAYFEDSLSPIGGGIAAVSGGLVTELDVSGLPSAPFTGVNLGSVRLVGTSDSGLYFGDGTAFQRYEFTGMPDNDIRDVTVTTDGTLTTLFRQGGGAELVNDQWTRQVYSTFAGALELMADPHGGLFAGTFGGGMWEINGDTYTRYDSTGTTLRGNDEGHNYVVVHGLATDARYLFASCYRAFTDHPIAFVDLDRLDIASAWDSIGLSEGITDDFVTEIDIRSGYLAMATEGSGVFRCYLGPDPHDKRDDFCQHLRRDNSRLISDDITDVRITPDGRLWVGTSFGLSRYNLGVDLFDTVYLPPAIGSEITALECDERGNMWVGSRTGLARVSAVDDEITVFTTVNSGLVSPEVTALHFDINTGNLYVATTNGLSLYRSDQGNPPTGRVEEVLAFPNPFVINGSEARLQFNFSRAGTVDIFTAAGERVRTVAVGEGWDGNNESGRSAAAGVYLFVVTDVDGNIGRGKFLLVR